ncbi:MAG: hypothetical protein IT328_00960 [Caldilineaceae bacterium]|nr:hypothetical protein [Caldilineaceae bacterium]
MDPQASLNRLQQLIGVLDSSLRLPNTPRTFMIYLAGLAIVFAGAFLHVLVAAQIMQAEFTLSRLQEEYRAIEQQNGDIIFQIARETNMARLQERIIAQGYEPVRDREYVFLPSESLADVEMVEESAQANAAPDALPNSDANPAASSQSAFTAFAAPRLPAVNLPTINLDGSQFARWGEFWNTTWRAASANAGVNAAPGSTTSSTTNIASSRANASSATPSQWTTWWEQVTAQGSKLLDQFGSQ